MVRLLNKRINLIGILYLKVRGMSIDEAIKQLSFHKLPTAIKMRDVRKYLNPYLMSLLLFLLYRHLSKHKKWLLKNIISNINRICGCVSITNL